MLRPTDGVTFFEARHTQAPLPVGLGDARVRALLSWRAVLSRLGLIGQDPARYDGVGFGNVSARLDAEHAVAETPAFLVSGTQTGGVETLTPGDLCAVLTYDLVENRVTSVGPTPPSSESMTHGALYTARADTCWVFHGHSPALWAAASALGLPTTSPDVPYGTPEMAAAVARLVHHGPPVGVLAMGGHIDGVVAYGPTADEAGAALVVALAAALQRTE